MIIVAGILISVIPSVLILMSLKGVDRGVCIKLLVLGVLPIAFACAAEDAGDRLLAVFWGEDTYGYAWLENFWVVALAEELGKLALFLAVAYRAARDRYEFAAYGICVGLGFGIIENVFYGLDGDLLVMAMRSIMSAPGHAMYGMIMGDFLYNFRCREGGVKKTAELFLALLIPLLLHGLYDFQIEILSDGMLLLLVADCVLWYTWAIRRFLKLRREGLRSPLRFSVPPYCVQTEIH